MRKWCTACNKAVEVNSHEEYEHGRLFYYTEECSVCCDDGLVEIAECPLCGDEMGEHDKFCSTCNDDVMSGINQTLTEFMEKYKLSVDQLEDVVADHFGW